MSISLLLVSELDFWCRARALYCSQLSQLFIYLILLPRKDCPSTPHGTRKTTHDFAPATWYPQPTTLHPRPTTLYPRPTTWYIRPTTLHPRPTTISYSRSEPTSTDILKPQNLSKICLFFILFSRIIIKWM